MKKEEIIDEMLTILLKENELDLPDVDQSEKREMLNSLMLVRAPGYLDERYLYLESELLKAENTAAIKHISDVDLKSTFHGDVLDLDADYVLMFLRGIDISKNSPYGRMILKDGLNLREDMTERDRKNAHPFSPSVEIFSPHNLNCKHLITLRFFDVDSLNSQLGVLKNLLSTEKKKTIAVDMSKMGEYVAIVKNFFKSMKKLKVVFGEI